MTATRVAGLREPGRYADGDGLYLLVAQEDMSLSVQATY